MKSGATLLDIERWLATTDQPIKEEALRKHRSQHVLGSGAVQAGPRPATDDFLTLLRDQVQADLASGEQRGTVRDGLAAQQQLDHRAERASDRDFMLQMAQILGGRARVIEGEYRVWDELLDSDEAELTKLLSPGSN